MTSRFTYQNFISSIGDSGLAFQNRFEINIAPPIGMNLAISDKFVHMFCKQVSVPGVNIATTQERLIGETIEIPYDRNFTGASLTFYTPNNFENKLFFDRWIDIIQNPKTRAIGFYSDYVSPKIEIAVIDRIGRISYTIELIEAHPKSIGAVQLDNETTGVYTFDVQFDYHYYSTKLGNAYDASN